MNLVIVESPSKSKTIEKYLGDQYKVTSSIGHIRDLATSGKEGLGIDVENGFIPNYIISKDKKEVVNGLLKLVKKAKHVYLATDPDREGEAISWHLAQTLNLDDSNSSRIVFNEITKNKVLDAIKHPRSIDMYLVKSQESRRMIDRIIGFKLSKLLQKKIHSKSAGRVQSIALRIICDREKQILSFVPEEYWNIKAIINANNQELELELSKIDSKKAKVTSKEQADEIVNQTNKTLVLDEIINKDSIRNPYLPFITSTLQQTSSSKLNYSAKRTMVIAQSLYEGVDLKEGRQGLITYMRTDSTRLSNEFVKPTLEYIENNYGKEYVGTYRVKNDANSQDAHEAIRPTSIENTPDLVKPYLTNEQYKLYKLIYTRTICSLMAQSKSNTTTYNFISSKYTYSISGTVITFDGFLKLYKDYDNTKDVILPNLNKNQEFDILHILPTQHFTNPPERYSESKLIKELEDKGVGRPSTYATILDTIVTRNYVELKKASETGKTKFFFPTEQGVVTDQTLRKYFMPVINIEYTASMESQLDEIASDNLNNIEFLKRFYNELQPLVENAYEKMEVIPLEKVDETCPLCQNELVIRNGRFGKFISCSSFPKCKYTQALNKKEKEPVEVSGKKCPKCNFDLVKRKSRFNTYFLGCSNFPKCEYMETLDGEEIVKKYSKKQTSKRVKK